MIRMNFLDLSNLVKNSSHKSFRVPLALVVDVGVRGVLPLLFD